MKLHDEVVGLIAKILQVALFTGTDVVDNLRTLDLTRQNGVLCLTKSYKSQFDANLETMISDAEDSSKNLTN